MQKKEAQTMKVLNGLTSTLSKNADLIGVGAGLLAGTTSGINDLMSIIDELMAGNIHLPNWEMMLPIFKPYAKQAALSYIAGEVISELNLGGTGKYGGIIKKASLAYGATSFLLHLAYYSTHASEGSNPVKGANSFLSQAPPTTNYSYLESK